MAKKPVLLRRASEHAKQQTRPVNRNKVRSVGKALYRLRHNVRTLGTSRHNEPPSHLSDQCLANTDNELFEA